MTQSEVIERCKQGDRDAQRQIYQSLSDKMFGVCLRYADCRADAEDILHDGFIHLFKKIGDFRGDGSFEGWSRRIFITIALSRIRRKKNYIKEEEIDSADKIPSQMPTVLATMESNEILKYIEKLPIRYRTILNLYSIEGYSHQEIATQLNISGESSRVGLLRAKAQLANLLTEAGILE